MAKITPIDIIKGVSGKFGGNSREYFATNKTSYNIYFAKRVNDFQGPATEKQKEVCVRSSSASRRLLPIGSAPTDLCDEGGLDA